MLKSSTLWIALAAVLMKILNEEENPKLRRNAIFVLSRSKNPEVLPLMAKLATQDPDAAFVYLGNIDVVA